MKRLNMRAGNWYRTRVLQVDIDDSDPCNKKNCMFSRSWIRLLVRSFGGDPEEYNVRSTDHGLVFDLDGRRFSCVFDSSTSRKIKRYDDVYQKTKSKKQARATVRPYWAKLAIESETAVPEYREMTEEDKERIRKYPPTSKPSSHSTRRRLSA